MSDKCCASKLFICITNLYKMLAISHVERSGHVGLSIQCKPQGGCTWMRLAETDVNFRGQGNWKKKKQQNNVHLHYIQYTSGSEITSPMLTPCGQDKCQIHYFCPLFNSSIFYKRIYLHVCQVKGLTQPFHLWPTDICMPQTLGLRTDHMDIMRRLACF